MKKKDKELQPVLDVKLVQFLSNTGMTKEQYTENTRVYIKQIREALNKIESNIEGFNSFGFFYQDNETGMNQDCQHYMTNNNAAHHLVSIAKELNCRF